MDFRDAALATTGDSFTATAVRGPAYLIPWRCCSTNCWSSSKDANYERVLLRHLHARGLLLGRSPTACSARREPTDRRIHRHYATAEVGSIQN